MPVAVAEGGASRFAWYLAHPKAVMTVLLALLVVMECGANWLDTRHAAHGMVYGFRMLEFAVFCLLACMQYYQLITTSRGRRQPPYVSRLIRSLSKTRQR